MPPIRVAILGLSSTGYWGASAHLPYLQQTSKYTISGVCNRTVSSGEAAKEAFKLAPSTKVYASPADLAADPDIDLVVCTTRVNGHFDTIKPALQNGKAVYCEWPLARNLAEAEELANLAQSNGCRTMVGLQARVSPVIRTIKDLVEGGKIGKVLSSNLVSATEHFGLSMPESVAYLADIESGGNMLTIPFGHTIDYVCFVLGELKDLSALLSVQRPTVDLTGGDGKRVRTAQRTSHDHISLQGHLKSGAVLSMQQRGGAPFKGFPSLTWNIYGEHGEIQVTSDNIFLQIGSSNVTINVFDHTTGEVETADWHAAAGAEEELPVPARNVALMYEAWTEGKTDALVDMEEAASRHKLLEQMYKSSQGGKYVDFA